MITIRPIQRHDDEVHAVATILVTGFADRSSAWPTVESGIHEVETYSTDVQISLVALLGTDVVGWISATPHYAEYGWELHPLVVAPDYQRRGIGAALVNELCARIATRGATVLYAWSDDEHLSTSLGGKSLLPNPLEHLRTFSSSARHAGGFYIKQGFTLCGVLPDANGRGKPDILFARTIP